MPSDFDHQTLLKTTVKDGRYPERIFCLKLDNNMKMHQYETLTYKQYESLGFTKFPSFSKIQIFWVLLLKYLKQ